VAEPGTNVCTITQVIATGSEAPAGPFASSEISAPNPP
jgi:hypothetical protein